MDYSVDFSGNNIYYDFLNLDISGTMTLDPSFIELYFMDGISGFDATANLDVSLNNFNKLFYVNVKLQDMLDNSYNDMKFAMDPSGWNNGSSVSFSSATVNKSDSISPDVLTSKQQIKYDLIRFFLNEITGTTKLNSLIRNKTELISSVVSIDASFQSKIVNIISSSGGTFQLPLDNSTMNPGSILLNSILGEDDQGIDNYNDTRKTTLLNYLNTKSSEMYQESKSNKYYFYGNTNEGIGWYYPLYVDPSHVNLSGIAYHNVQFDNNGRIFYMPDASSNNAINPKPTFDGTYTDYSIVDNSFIPIPFYDGDKLAVKLTYYPKNNIISGNSIGNRSYKVILNLKDVSGSTPIVTPPIVPSPSYIDFTFVYYPISGDLTIPPISSDNIGAVIYTADTPFNGSVRKQNGSTWDILGTASGGSFTDILADNNDIYVTGSFGNISGVTGTKRLAKWNGTAWSGFGDISANVITCILVDGTDIYVGGANFTNAGGVPVSGIAKWNGTTWSSLGTGLSSSTGTVNTIKKYNNHIYIGGNFTGIGGIGTMFIAKWDGTSWSSVGSSLTLVSGVADVYRIGFNDSDIYVSTFSGGSKLLKWNGTTWTTLVNSVPAVFIETFVIDAPNIYIGGNFSSLNGVNVKRIAKWNGTNITTAGYGFDNYSVRKLKIMNQRLYATGTYTSSNNNNSMKYITEIR